MVLRSVVQQIQPRKQLHKTSHQTHGMKIECSSAWCYVCPGKRLTLLLNFLKVCFGLKTGVAAANSEKEKSLFLLLSAAAHRAVRFSSAKNIFLLGLYKQPPNNWSSGKLVRWRGERVSKP